LIRHRCHPAKNIRPPICSLSVESRTSRERRLREARSQQMNSFLRCSRPIKILSYVLDSKVKHP
jgi:hypothetical protein